MSTPFQPSKFLRLALIGDALASGATGLLLAGGAGVLTGWLGLPEPLMRFAGLFLLPYAAIVGWIGTRSAVSRAAVWVIIVANLIWVVESVVLLISGWVSPTPLGYAFVLAQAAVVAAFASAQFIGLDRRHAASTANASVS